MFDSKYKITMTITMTDIKNNIRPIAGLILLGLAITFSMISYYNSIYNLRLSSEISNQKSRAEVIAQRIESYSAVASQLGRTLQNHFSKSKLNQKEIEEFLIESVKSGPEKLIYGVGIFFEPYKMIKNKKFFGPYAHRKLNDVSEIQITYEWSTDAYNYHQQGWYKKGLLASKDGVFVEPYFDTDLVYVTLVTPLYDTQNKILAVISVDMVLPQLQLIIDEINVDDHEIIYIQSRNGFLLAHPQKDLFYEKNKSFRSKSLIDFKIEDFKESISSKIDANDMLVYTETIPDLGWQVVVESQKIFVLKDSARLLHILYFYAIFLWLSVLLASYFCMRAYRIKSENKRREAEQQAQLLNSSRLATLGEFSSGIAHEINNPLAIIYGKSELLLSKIEKKSANESEIIIGLEKIKLNADRITKIMRGLKTFARDGKNDPCVTISLKDLFSETFSMAKERLSLKNIKFEIKDFDDVKIFCRPNQISQVLLNLLNNSIDAIESQALPWISIEVHCNQEIQILFTDSGSGITEDIALNMMNSFYTTKDFGKGTGLGLSISEAIMKEHQGSLVYNRGSANTQFILQLPKL